MASTLAFRNSKSFPLCTAARSVSTSLQPGTIRCISTLTRLNANAGGLRRRCVTQIDTEFRGLRRYGRGRNAYYAIRLGRILTIKRWKP